MRRRRRRRKREGEVYIMYDHNPTDRERPTPHRHRPRSTVLGFFFSFFFGFVSNNTFALCIGATHESPPAPRNRLFEFVPLAAHRRSHHATLFEPCLPKFWIQHHTPSVSLFLLDGPSRNPIPHSFTGYLYCDTLSHSPSAYILFLTCVPSSLSAAAALSLRGQSSFSRSEYLHNSIGRTP